MVLGIMLVIYGVADLINVFILKRYVREFSKKMKVAKKYLTDDIQEAEVIREDKKQKSA